MARPTSLEAALMASPDDTERQFYEALQRGDIDRLMSVWSDDDDIACVHSGGPRVFGAAAIRAAFASRFASGPVDVRPEQIRRVLAPSCAVHNVLERIHRQTDAEPGFAWVIATNVYIKTMHGWRLTSHHASPESIHETPDELRESPSVLH